MKLKIFFSDFWSGFDYNDNIFINLLKNHFEIKVDCQNPDILFFSCFGFDNINYKCLKIFFAGENVRPNYNIADFSISFDWNAYGNKNMRLPLLRFNGNLEKFEKTIPINDIPIAEKKFCCTVVSNSGCKERNFFFEVLSKYKKVDSGGRYKNNIGGPVDNKLEFIKQYKFVFSFENSSFPGHTTEKIVDAISVGSIPIYWGNPLIGKDFNDNRIINIENFHSFEEAIDFIIELDSNDNLYREFCNRPIFPDGKLPAHLKWESIEHELIEFIWCLLKQKPIATTSKIYPHYNKFKRMMLSRIYRKPQWAFF